MAEIKEEKLREEIQQASISLVIDTYDDIFSDFDPRPFSERALSDDFLLECRNAARDKGNYFEVILSVPKAIRNINNELKIRKRLKEHFRKHHQEKEKEIKKVKKDGRIWVGIGVLILMGVVYGLLNVTNTFFEALIAIFEIPSWFLVWEGMGKIFIDSRKLESEHIFYQKMANAIFTFREY